MSPWIQVYANLPTHRKTCKMRDALGLKNNYEAVGLLVCLWAWMAVNAPSGSLAGFSSRDIADAAGYKKSPEKLMEAFVESGFFDRNDDCTLVAHDWDEHAGLLQDILEEQKRKTRDRVRKHREKKKAVADGMEKPSNNSGECNVTETLCNAPTKPNLTKPNLSMSVVVGKGEDSMGVTTTTAPERKVKKFEGVTGRGVIFLSDAQFDELVELMDDTDVVDMYIQRLADFVIRTGAQLNHFETILKWWREDGQV